MNQDSGALNRETSQSCSIGEPATLRKCCRPDFGQMTDCELLQAFVENHCSDAMTEFVSRHSLKVLTVCRTINSDRNDVDDAYQATFLAAVKNARRLESVSSHGGWLCRVAYNASLKAKKSKRRMLSLDATIRTASQPDPIPETWEIIEMRETTSRLLDELFRLPRDYQDCLLLAYFEDLSRAEIALRMDRSESSVKALLQRGKKMLKSRVLRNGAIPAVVLAGIGHSISSTICANELTLQTVQYCHALNHLEKFELPENVLRLLESANSVVQIQLAVGKVAISAVCFLLIGIAGLAAIPAAGSGGHSVNLLLAEVQQDEHNNPTIQSAIFEVNQIPLHDIAANLKSQISSDKARLKQLAEWTHHKKGFIEQSRNEQEVLMLRAIVDELKVETSEIQTRLAANVNLLANVQAQSEND